MDKSRLKPSAPRFVLIHNFVNPETGLTIKQENMKLVHNIPLGTLVELKFDSWFGEGACWKAHARLWVVAHRRDCDGTPLYSVSQWKDAQYAMSPRMSPAAHHGFGEEALTPVKVTDQVREGWDVLEWPEEEE